MRFRVHNAIPESWYDFIGFSCFVPVHHSMNFAPVCHPLHKSFTLVAGVIISWRILLEKSLMVFDVS
jgi:hypothetical protein